MLSTELSPHVLHKHPEAAIHPTVSRPESVISKSGQKPRGDQRRSTDADLPMVPATTTLTETRP